MVGLASDGGAESVPEGGRVCSLEYRPRRWFGFKLERVLREFLGTECSELAGLGATMSDLLKGVVRPGSDRCVRVAAHHSRTKGLVLATVEITCRVPSSDPEHVWAIVGWLGRARHESSYFRLGTLEGELPVQATLLIESEILGVRHGETDVRTTFVIRAWTRPRRSEPSGRSAEGSGTRGQLIKIRGS